MSWGLTFRKIPDYGLDGLMDASHGREVHRTAAGYYPANSLTAAEDEERFYRSVLAFRGTDVRAGA